MSKLHIDFKGIIEGAFNSIFVRKEIEEIAEERTKICRDCTFNSDYAKAYSNYKTFRPDFHCTQCGCDLHLKTRSLSQNCPMLKWKAFMSQEEEYKLEEKLKENNGKDNHN